MTHERFLSPDHFGLAAAYHHTELGVNIDEFQPKVQQDNNSAQLEKLHQLSPPPVKERTFKCRHCDFQVQNKVEFWRHARRHMKPEKILECAMCEFVTEYRHHLEYHERNHKNQKPFQCDKCEYKCVNRSMLNSHLKSHTTECHYRCRDCPYATKYCHSLKTHLRKNGHTAAEKSPAYQRTSSAQRQQQQDSKRREILEHSHTDVEQMSENCDAEIFVRQAFAPAVNLPMFLPPTPLFCPPMPPALPSTTFAPLLPWLTPSLHHINPHKMHHRFWAPTPLDLRIKSKLGD